MNNKSQKTFYPLIVIFILILVSFVAQNIFRLVSYPIFFSYTRNIFSLLIVILELVFLIQGIRLMFTTTKEKGKLKLFLMLTGVSAIILLPSAILHNLFYGFATVSENFEYLFKALHVVFFIVGIVVTPVTFIVGVIGSIILFKSKRYRKGISAE